MKNVRTFILSEEQINRIIGEQWMETDGTDDEVKAADSSSQVYATDIPTEGMPEPIITDKLKMTNDMGMLWKNGGVTFSAVKESRKKKELTERSEYINGGNRKANFSDAERSILGNERDGSLAKKASNGEIDAEQLVYTLSRRDVKLRNGDIEGANKIASDDSADILRKKYDELKKQASNYHNAKKLTQTQTRKSGGKSKNPGRDGILKIEA